MSAARDTGLKTVSTVVAGLVNGMIFAGMAMAGLIGEEPPPPPLDAIETTIVTLPKLGTKPPDPKALPRIVEPAPPPPPKDEEISLSREKEEELEREKEAERKKELERIEAQKRKEEEEKKRKELEDKRRREEDERRRKKAMEQALNRATDPRADDEDAPGFEEGVAEGNSLDPNSIHDKQLYRAQLMTVLKREFKVPGVIPADVRKRLQATIWFKINAQGKVIGEPKIRRRSGNEMFDNAAMTTVRKFGPGSALRIPLPSNDKLRETVLRIGLEANMKGEDL